MYYKINLNRYELSARDCRGWLLFWHALQRYGLRSGCSRPHHKFLHRVEMSQATHDEPVYQLQWLVRRYRRRRWYVSKGLKWRKSATRQIAMNSEWAGRQYNERYQWRWALWTAPYTHTHTHSKHTGHRVHGVRNETRLSASQPDRRENDSQCMHACTIDVCAVRIQQATDTQDWLTNDRTERPSSTTTEPTQRRQDMSSYHTECAWTEHGSQQYTRGPSMARVSSSNNVHHVSTSN